MKESDSDRQDQSIHLRRPSDVILHSNSELISNSKNLNSRLNSILHSKFQFSTDCQENETYRRLLSSYLAYLGRSKDLSNPLSLEAFLDQIFIPFIQSQSRSTEKLFADEVEEPVSKVIQSIYSYALSQTNVKSQEDSALSYWLKRYSRIHSTQVQMVYGAFKGGYLTGLRPALEMLFGVVDLVKSQSQDLSVFPKISQQVQVLSDQLQEQLGEFSLTSENHQHQLQLDLNRTIQQMAQSIADAIEQRWKKAQQESKESELIAEWVTSGFLVFDGAVKLGQAVSRGAVFIAKHAGNVLGMRLPSSLEADLNQVIRVKRIAINDLKADGRGSSNTAIQVTARQELLSLLNKREEFLRLVDVSAKPKKIPAKYNSPREAAASWQGNDPYPGIDLWRNIVLKKGTLIVGGLPGQGNFYSTFSTIRRANLDADRIFKGLQVRPQLTPGPMGSKLHLHRYKLGIFKVKEDIPAAFGRAVRNSQFGIGGFSQIYIEDFKNTLQKVAEFELYNTIRK